MRFWMSFIALWAFQAKFLFAQNPWMHAFNRPDILHTYSEKLHSFEFKSESTLTLSSVPNATFSGHSHLSFISSNRQHFRRALFTDASDLEVTIDHSKALVQMPWQGSKKTETRVSSEIKLWANTILSEVFDVFKQAEFDDHFSEKPTLEGEKACFRERRGFLCFDQMTKLPLEGHIKIELSNETTLQTRFIIGFFKKPKKTLP